MSEENTQPQEQQVSAEDRAAQMVANLQGLLTAFPSAPNKEQIDAWKSRYRDIFVSGFSDSEIYIWRAITRPEYVQVQRQLQEPNSPIDQFKLEEMVCETCVLWKSVDVSWTEGKAGTPNALSEQIMQNSNFLSPQAASMLVIKL